MLMTPRCYDRKCKHLIGVKQDDGDEETERNVCEAFPDGIPDEIDYGNNKHLEPYAGQENDIIYEKKVA